MAEQTSNNKYQQNERKNPEPVKEFSVGDLLNSLWSDKWVIVIITLVVFNISLFQVIQEEPVYLAESTVQVNIQDSDMPLDVMQENTHNLGNEMVILKSRNITRQVADTLLERQYLDEERSEVIPILYNVNEEGEIVSPASPEVISSRIESAIDVDYIPGSDIIKIFAESEDPREAALLANTFAEIYYNKHVSDSRNQVREMREFLESQLEQKANELSIAEKRFQSYMEEHGVVVIDEESKQIIEQHGRLETLNDELEVEIHKAESGLASLKEQLSGYESEVAEGIASSHNPYIQRIQEQIAELELQRDLVVSQNPEYVNSEQYRDRIDEIENRLTSLRSMLQENTEKFIQSLTPGDEEYLREVKQRIIEEQIELQGLRIQKEANNALLLQYDEQLQKLPEMNVEHARLERARQSAEELYLMIEEKYNEVVIAEQSEFGSIEILDEAVVPSSPERTNYPLTMGAGLMFGVSLGVGFVLLKGAVKKNIRIPEDLRAQGFTILSTIPLMYDEVRRINKRGMSVIKGKVINGSLITLTNPMSHVSESFRALRIKLQYIKDNPMKSVVITSPNPGDGKTIVAANLAIAYAQADAKVLLVDTDLRKPSIHTLLDLNKKPGLVDILLGNTGLNAGIQPSVVENLQVITAGGVLSNAADHLDSKKMKNLIQALKKRFDIVIFDTPPILAATDAPILSTLGDGVVLVASSRETTTGDLNIARERIERVHGRVTGCVLNKFNYKDQYSHLGMYQYYRYNA